MIFKRRRKAQCVHSWVVVDLEVIEEYNGVSIDLETYVVLVCGKCKESRKVSENTYRKMNRLGFISAEMEALI